MTLHIAGILMVALAILVGMGTGMAVIGDNPREDFLGGIVIAVGLEIFFAILVLGFYWWLR